ncbi:MAG: hypothetical protein RSF93_04160 [Mucinivorans sp.]
MKDQYIVKVGPVHAGIIEPGVFRFTCAGEKVEALELELGYQHRGIEALIVANSDNVWRMMALAEQIAGDTTVGHATAMAKILDPIQLNPIIRCERLVALEMERIAMNIADAAGMSGDMAYRLAYVGLQALRTLIINAMQRWSGSRFARTLIRPAGSFYRLDLDLIKDFEQTLHTVLPRIEAIRVDLFSSPSVLSRLEEICIMKAPAGRYCGDLSARLAMRFDQIAASGAKITEELNHLKAVWFETYCQPNMEMPVLAPNTTLSAYVEGWRGRITHRATTDARGRIVQYKIIDPSAALWSVMCATMVGGEISDFPLHNKSFNLSYSGVDL